MLEGLACDVCIDTLLVELVRAENLDVHAHLVKRLLERSQEVLGVGDVTALGVRHPREAVPHELLEILRHAGRYLAQRVDGVSVEDKTDPFSALSQSVCHRLADENLAQVADVDVAGGADAGHDHVRASAQVVGDLSGPAGYGNGYGDGALVAHGILPIGLVIERSKET